MGLLKRCFRACWEKSSLENQNWSDGKRHTSSLSLSYKHDCTVPSTTLSLSLSVFVECQTFYPSTLTLQNLVFFCYKNIPFINFLSLSLTIYLSQFLSISITISFSFSLSLTITLSDYLSLSYLLSISIIISFLSIFLLLLPSLSISLTFSLFLSISFSFSLSLSLSLPITLSFSLSLILYLSYNLSLSLSLLSWMLKERKTWNDW